MTLQEQLEYISSTFESGLPTLLTNTSLKDFDEYLPTREKRSNDLELCVYVDYVKNSTSMIETAFLVKAQLYKIDEGVKYYDVINKFITENIKPSDLGYTNRVLIDSDFYPADQQMTSYVFFSIVFNTELDDCYEDDDS